MKEKFECIGITLTDQQEEQLKQYYQLLKEWNKKINLTSILGWEDVVRKHFLDSALVMQSDIWKKDKRATVLDIGTGAGFPGMVLAILNPQMQISLLDSLKKRTDFLEAVAQKLALENVSVYHGRAESYGRNPQFREQYDFVVSRAVAELPVLMEYCIPFAKEGGYFVSYKGKKQEEEIQKSGRAFDELSAKVELVEKYQLGEGEHRSLIYIKKHHVTCEKYPRREGKPKKNPL